MRYVLEENLNDLKDVTGLSSLDGLKILPNKFSSLKSIIVKEVTLTDEHLTNTYVQKLINKKFSIIFKKMYLIINNDDSTSTDASILLDETARLKGIIINKYKKHISLEEYKDLLKKIIMLEEQFKRMYSEKEYERLQTDFDKIRGISI